MALTRTPQAVRLPAWMSALLIVCSLFFLFGSPLGGDRADAATTDATAIAAADGDTAAALAADRAWALGAQGIVGSGASGVEASAADAVDPSAPVVGILFPLENRITWVDTWGAPRDGGTRLHVGNDLMVPKMTPLLAVVDGEVDWLNLDGSSSSYYLLLRGDDGNDYFYIHINNDTPGTDDGLGGPTYAYAPRVVAGGDGTHVECGEVIAYAGDSGNAESSGSHLHFELHYGGYKNPVDPYNSLMAAPTLAEWIAAGRPDLTNPSPTIPCAGLRGTDRFDTAIKISQAMFPDGLPAGSGLVLAPGETFQEALCGASLAAASGGPVLLTPGVGLNNAVRDEILRLGPSYVVCIGLSGTVVEAVETALGTGAAVVPINGMDVYDMSYKVAKALGDKVGDMSGATAIVTMGTLFPDAIGVAPLACAKLWPILLTDSATDPLHASALAAINELGITKALKVGTYATLPDGVNGLANLSGADRYYTNRNVAEWAKTYAGLSFAHLGVATGDKFPDALASGPYLALDDGILLLSPLNGPLPTCIAAEIGTNKASITKASFIAIIEPVLSQVRCRLP